MDEQVDEAQELIADVRSRLARKTMIQDVTEPLTGEIDRRRLAQRINNVETAVDHLADAVEQVIEERRAS